MRGLYSLCLGLFFSVAGLLPARALNGQCTIDFHGSSTLHDFDGQVHSQPYEVEIHREADGTERWNATLSVHSVEMDTQNTRRDKNMRSWLRVADFPLIEGVICGTNPSIYRGGKDSPPLPITLTLVGRQKILSTAVRNWQETDREILFHVEFAISLKEFGLQPPSLLGMIRVQDRVDIICHVKLLKN